MKKLLIFSSFFTVSFFATIIYRASNNPKPLYQFRNYIPPTEHPDISALRTRYKAQSVRQYASANGYSTQYCFLIDMGLPSGRKRFFVYHFALDTIINSGMVAHGSCNSRFIEKPEFSNTVGGGCSSLGKFAIGMEYQGRFGTAFKLHGLDSTNSKAYERNVVLHGYSGVPDEETVPYPICNSLGCPMISYSFLDYVGSYIRFARKPVLLWIYE